MFIGCVYISLRVLCFVILAIGGQTPLRRQLCSFYSGNVVFLKATQARAKVESLNLAH